MLEILKTLRDTPLPIILVIGGLVFLLVLFIRRVSDKVEVETTNKGLAGFIGFILLAIGIGLYVIPSQAVTQTNPSSSPTAITFQTQEPVNVPTKTSLPTTQPSVNNKCSAYVTRTQVNDLKNIQGVSEALTQAQVYSGYLQIDFKPGDKIPVGALIATDFLTTDLGQFNVIRINSSGGWGLFETTTEIQATTPGTYRCISE